MQKIGGDLIVGDNRKIPISKAVAANGFVFVSGQLALRDGKLVSGDIAEQTNLTLDNIQAVLALAGLGLEDICKTTAWLTREDDFPAFNAAYGARMSEPYPARSTVVSTLLIPGALVEIEAMARERSGH